MMAFVEDHQAVAVAPALQVDVGRIVGRDRQRLQIVRSSTDQANRYLEGCEQLVVPLVEQVDGRSNNQAGPTGLLNGQNGDMSLSGPGGQHHDAMAAMAPPGLESLGLVREWITARAERPGGGLVVASLVLKGQLMPAQVFDDGPVTTSFGPNRVGTGIDLAAGKLRELVRGSARDHQSTPVERQVNGSWVHFADYDVSVPACPRQNTRMPE